MALIPCPDCKKMISPSTPQCPKCGCQITEEYRQKITEKQEKNKRINKKIMIGMIIAFFAIAIIGNIIGPKPGKNDIAYGKLLSVTDARDANGTVSVRVKINSNLTNKMTIDQNYNNVVDLITKKGYDNCKLRYFAVMDRTDGSENKIMSFTVPYSVVDRVASGEIVAIQLPDYVTDLWIHSQFID